MAKITASLEYDPLTEAFLVFEQEHLALLQQTLNAARTRRAGVASVTLLHGGSQPSEGHAEAVEGNGRWTREMIRLLSTGISSPSLRLALDTVAEASPRVVPYERMLEATGATSHGLRAELASLSKLSRRLFDQRMWPMTARQGMAGGSQMGYRMPKVVAGWWLAVSRDEAQGA